MGLTQEDLKPYEGKYLSRLLFELAGGEYDEIDDGQIVKVTPSALHLDTSRNISVVAQEGEEATVIEQPAQLIEIYPLSKILVIEIDMEASK